MRTWAEVNLDAVKHNLEIIKSHTNSKILGIIKAIYDITKFEYENSISFYFVNNSILFHWRHHRDATTIPRTKVVPNKKMRQK